MEQPRFQSSLLSALPGRREPLERCWGWKLSTFLALFVPNYFRQRFLYGPKCSLERTYSVLPATWTICACPSPPMLTTPSVVGMGVKSYSVEYVHFSTSEIGATQLCAPKSPFLCVNRSHIRYGFLAGVKAIRYGVNIALIKTIVSSRDFVFTDAILDHFCSPNIRRTHPTYGYYALVCFNEE